MAEWIGLIPSVAAAIAAVSSCIVTHRAHKFQKTVAANTFLYIKYKYEIDHLQRAVTLMTQLLAAARMHIKLDVEKIHKSSRDILISISAIQAVNDELYERIENWSEPAMHENMDNSIVSRLHSMQYREDDLLSLTSDKLFSKKRNELMEIRDRRFDEIIAELGLRRLPRNF